MGDRHTYCTAQTYLCSRSFSSGAHAQTSVCLGWAAAVSRQCTVRDGCSIIQRPSQRGILLDIFPCIRITAGSFAAARRANITMCGTHKPRHPFCVSKRGRGGSKWDSGLREGWMLRWRLPRVHACESNTDSLQHQIHIRYSFLHHLSFHKKRTLGAVSTPSYSWLRAAPFLHPLSHNKSSSPRRCFSEPR